MQALSDSLDSRRSGLLIRLAKRMKKTDGESGPTKTKLASRIVFVGRPIRFSINNSAFACPAMSTNRRVIRRLSRCETQRETDV